tara:strand:+ start:4440 stop:7322 length:2883 start_codon:yes stop_codon:yes gene_type:complete
MAVTDFKFVSPGVFIHEIDNSFNPKKADSIGPVVIGRSTRGLGMQPVKVQSYSQFVEMFGDTVPGFGGGDVYRDGNDMQAPMYGTYAAKAFLRANVAPLTYVRLLGQQDSAATAGSGQAGWKTDNALGSGGGAIGLWVFTSGAVAAGNAVEWTGSNAGQLAAVWYLDSGTIMLSGSLYSTASSANNVLAAGALVNSDANGEFKVQVVNTNTSKTELVTFGFDDSKESFLRKKFNTNPQLRYEGDFYASTSEKDYWLGESYEQELRDAGLTSGNLVGLIAGIALSGSHTETAPSLMKGQSTREATAGWFIGQDIGSAGDFNPANTQKLFRVLGRGHGEWLQRNCKVSITKIRRSTTTATDYGTFSLVIRKLTDTDNAIQIMERFDNLTLDPTSPNFIAKKVGTVYLEWDATEKRLKEYGEYPNFSKFIRIEMNADVEAGASDATLLPFGYYGPPQPSNVTNLSGGFAVASTGSLSNKFITFGSAVPGWYSGGSSTAISSACGPLLTASLKFPSVRLRNSASDGGLSDATRAAFGMQTTRTSGSTRADLSCADPHRLPYAGFAPDPVGTAILGFDSYSYIFTMDNVVSASATNYFYSSGSRTRGDSTSAARSYRHLLDAGYDSFTAPFWGAFDGFDIRVPDPMYNTAMPVSPSDTNSSIYYTWKKAIDTVADPEFINMNLLAAPGLTNTTLTKHMISMCEDRADALAIVDLPSVYLPPHEQYKADKKDRIGTTPTDAANDLRSRGIDSSYGCCFYPWVQTRDDHSGQLVWIPPSVAMMGVLASSEKKSKLWFAPAGFNRGGLTEGAAGIPVMNITERLTSKNRDDLYTANINPIASFPSTGIVVFGQKTLQQRSSALDRINVRRLVIFLKKQISIISSQILFEQNVQQTWTRFKGLTEPFLANVMTQFGITNYSLILDETTTTADLIDQNVLYAKIMIMPARAIEYIAIDFVITNTGASFSD